MSGKVFTLKKRMDVERLVTWALLDQGLGWVGRERSRLDFSDYGAVIDDGDYSGSHPSIALLSHDDAHTVRAVIDALPDKARVLLIQYGRSSLRPDWCEEGYGKWEQARDARGRLRWEWADPVNRTGDKRPLMEFNGLRTETVDWHRAQYEVWWCGLAEIVAPLNNRMGEHLATGPEAPRKPWLAQVRPASTMRYSSSVRRKLDLDAPDEMSVAERIAHARAPVRARATDWDFPARAKPLTADSPQDRIAPQKGKARRA